MNRYASTRKRSWEESYEALKQYKAKHGDCLVPIHTHYEDPALGGWVHHQRSKKEKLTEEQRQKLDDIGFVWKLRIRNKQWNTMISRLKEYDSMDAINSEDEDEIDDREVRKFIKEQRLKYLRGQLSSQRQKQLERIGLNLRVGSGSRRGNNRQHNNDSDADDADDDSDDDDGDDEEEQQQRGVGGKGDDDEMIIYDEKFKQMYQKLVDFHINNGHYRIPLFSRRGDNLGLWVSALRRKYMDNPNLIDDKCHSLLDDINFDWYGLPANNNNMKNGDADDNNNKGNSSSGEEDDDEEDDDDGDGSSSDGSGSDSEESDSHPLDVKKNENKVAVHEDGIDSDEDVSSEGEDDGGDDTSESSSSSSSSNSSSDDSDSDSDDDAEKKKQSKKKNGTKKRKHRDYGDSDDDDPVSDDINDDDEADDRKMRKLERKDSRGARFMKHYNELLTFKRKHGHVRVPQNNKYKTLGGWVNNLRVIHKQSPENITPDRRKLLNDIGFIWDASSDRPSNDARWDAQFDQLVKFQKQYGHCRCPQTGPHRKLGRWVATQRSLHARDRENGIRPDRLQKLNDLGFTWDAREYKGKHFYASSDPNDPDGDGVGGGDRNGGACSKKRGIPTSVAVAKVADDSSATESDGELATAIPVGEDWPTGNMGVVAKKSKTKNDAHTFEANWDEQYKKLVKFQKLNGHCRCHHKVDRELARFIKRQKIHKDLLSPNRVKLLDDLNFEWETSNSGDQQNMNDARWDQSYQQLVEFQKEHGHCLVPQNGENKQLGRWVATQRLKHNKDPAAFPATRLEKLVQIGFVWNAKLCRSRRYSMLSVKPANSTKSTDINSENNENNNNNYMISSDINNGEEGPASAIPIEPLAKKLCNLLDQDLSDVKRDVLKKYKETFEDMIRETEQRVEGNTKSPNTKKRRLGLSKAPVSADGETSSIKDVASTPKISQMSADVETAIRGNGSASKTAILATKEMNGEKLGTISKEENASNKDEEAGDSIDIKMDNADGVSNSKNEKAYRAFSGKCGENVSVEEDSNRKDKVNSIVNSKVNGKQAITTQKISNWKDGEKLGEENSMKLQESSKGLLLLAELTDHRID